VTDEHRVPLSPLDTEDLRDSLENHIPKRNHRLDPAQDSATGEVLEQRRPQVGGIAGRSQRDPGAIQ
jgi:hypothetical protein